jgi:hypothetical protein
VANYPKTGQAVAKYDRPGDLVQVRGDRVQRPPDPVIIEQPGLDAERLADRPVPRPRLDIH